MMLPPMQVIMQLFGDHVSAKSMPLKHYTNPFSKTTVATSPVALRWMCDSPQTGRAWRTTIHICGANKQ